MMPSTGQSRDGTVTIDLGAKGVIEVQLVASGDKWGRGPAKDIHSSLMARVDSPAWHLVKRSTRWWPTMAIRRRSTAGSRMSAPSRHREKELLAASLPKDEEAVKKVLGVRRSTSWIEDFLASTYRLASQPTVNIQGLVSGYTGPGGKTVLPGRAEAKLDFRLVPDMTKEEAVGKLKAHLAKRGFGDIEVIVSGGYSPTESPEDSVIIQAGAATLKQAGIAYSLFPRRAGRWPGVVFTGPPLKMAAGHFGVGRGGGAHAPDEWILIESSDPKVAGYEQQAQMFVDYLYETARVAKSQRQAGATSDRRQPASTGRPPVALNRPWKCSSNGSGTDSRFAIVIAYPKRLFDLERAPRFEILQRGHAMSGSRRPEVSTNRRDDLDGAFVGRAAQLLHRKHGRASEFDVAGRGQPADLADDLNKHQCCSRIAQEIARVAPRGDGQRHQPGPRGELRPLVDQDRVAGRCANARRIDVADNASYAGRHCAMQFAYSQIDVAGKHDRAGTQQFTAEIRDRPNDRIGPEGSSQQLVLQHAVLDRQRSPDVGMPQWLQRLRSVDGLGRDDQGPCALQ